MNESSASEKLLSGSAWITVSEVVSGISSLAGSIIAARVLAPDDFGLMGIVLLTISILEALSKTGFKNALIQRADDIDDLLDVAWTWHVVRGVALGGLVVAAAPFLADWYGKPVLFPLLAVSASYVILQGLQNIGTVFFSRDLDFKKIFLINSLRSVVRLGVFIPAILILENVWALLIGFVGGSVVALVISYIAHPYRPSLEWNWTKAKKLINFGKWITGLSIIGFVNTEGDDVFVSKFLGAEALGFYRLAYEISNWPATKVTHVLSKVSFPTYSRLQDDEEALRAAFKGVMRSTLLISGAVTALVWIMAPYIVDLIIGEKWTPIIPLIKILAVAGLVRSVAALGGALFQAANRPDLDFKMNLPRLAVIVTLIWPFSAQWGLEGACFVVLLAIASTLPVWFYGLHKIAGLRFLDVIRVNSLAAVSTAVLAGALVALQIALGPGWVGFAGTLAGSIAAWLAAMWVIGKVSPLDFYGEIAGLKQAFKAD
jgi:O-antigen/teichoic acid export membrane protein